MAETAVLRKRSSRRKLTLDGISSWLFTEEPLRSGTMSYEEDLRTLATVEKARIVSVILAFVCLGLAVAFDSAFFTALRLMSWLAGAFFSAWEGRVLARLGRDADYSYLRAVLFGVIAIVNLVLAIRD